MYILQQFIFYVVSFLITYLIYVYPYDVLESFIFKDEIFHFSSFLISSICYVFIIFYLKSNNTFLPLRIFVFEGMGIGFISFLVVNTALIIDYVFSFERFYLGVFCLFSIIIITILSLIKGRSINIKELELSSPKVEKIKLIFISDIHMGSNPKNHLAKILKKISDLEFDLLLVGGDLIDSSAFNLSDLNLFKNVKKPILFASGNHEYYIKDHKIKLRDLINYNITFLDNNSFKFGNLNIIGISDNQTLQSQTKISESLIREGCFNLIIVHKPSLWDEVFEKTDLMLSGHTHNGQIFPFNLLVKLQFKNIYGLYRKIGSTLYVSSGAGCWGPRMRLGTRNEVVQISLNKN